MLTLDEYTFAQVLGQTEASRQLQQHWSTWYTEADIARLASYGINHIRIPIGFWAWDVSGGEPYVQGAADYLALAIGWAKNYGLRVMIDLHGAPGSQNGYDNSGHKGGASWQTSSPDNIPRTLSVLKIIASTYGTDEYKGVVTAIEVINEPVAWDANSIATIKQFYDNAYTTVRAASSDNQLLIVMHDAFQPLSSWQGFMPPPQSQGVSLDTHIYHVFDRGQLAWSQSEHLQNVCDSAADIASSNENLWTMVGEFSLATTDCTRWLNSFGSGARYDGTYPTAEAPEAGPICTNCTCESEGNLDTFTDDYKSFLRAFAETQMKTYEQNGSGWFFWTGKTESSPQWDYMLGVEQGWIPNPPGKYNSAVC